MTDESIRRILEAPVTMFRPSSEAEEQALFHKTKGRFYTIGLKSGQSFVAQFPGQNDEDDPFALDNFVFSVRPLNNLVPRLQEIKWVFIGASNGTGIRTLCDVAPGTSEQERRFFEDVFGTHMVRPSYLGKGGYQPHEIFVKLHDVYEQLLENDRLERALVAGRQKLRALMMLDNNNLMNHYVESERR